MIPYKGNSYIEKGNCMFTVLWWLLWAVLLSYLGGMIAGGWESLFLVELVKVFSIWLTRKGKADTKCVQW